MKWSCYYCKKEFKSLFNRDLHHREHPEHFKKMVDALLSITNDLQIDNNILKKKLEDVTKEAKE